MNDYEYTFKQDVREKKSIAHSARNRKNGSKSKYVSLPHDHLTKKQKEALNGPVEVIHLGKPMDWATFKGVRKDLQEQYLANLRDTYSVTLKEIAEMMGTTQGRLSSYKSELNLNVPFSRGARRKDRNPDQLEAWRRFCEGEVEEETQVIEEPVEAPTFEYSPLTWDGFVAMSHMDKVEYLLYIRQTFGVGVTLIAQMLNVGRTVMYSYCVRNGLDYILKGKTSPTEEQTKAFEAFCESKPVEVETIPEAKPEPEPAEMTLQGFSLEFGGQVSIDKITRMIRQMTGKDILNGTIRIEFEGDEF